LAACESAIQAAGFHSAELVATLAGEPFYTAFDYSPAERYEIPMATELTLPVVHMTKHFGVAQPIKENLKAILTQDFATLGQESNTVNIEDGTTNVR
jgi:predicted N-acetyltransferase YhbS